jgi:hypothetical protein
MQYVKDLFDIRGIYKNITEIDETGKCIKEVYLLGVA